MSKLDRMTELKTELQEVQAMTFHNVALLIERNENLISLEEKSARLAYGPTMSLLPFKTRVVSTSKRQLCKCLVCFLVTTLLICLYYVVSSNWNSV